jgi:diguanylate cyclase (GGDEF)-like protein/PAS domain S-box-containing protein
MIARLLGTAAEQRDLAEMAVHQSEERFRTLVQQSSDLITVVDAAGRITFASSSSASLLGYDADHLVGSAALELVHPDELDELSLELHALLAQPEGMVRRQQRMRTSNGQYRWFEAIARNLLHDPAVAGIVINQRDVTEQRSWNDTLLHQASHDVLTDLPNRASFLERLDQALSRSRRQGGAVAVLFIDLDGFKLVNDSLGHQTGDFVLCQIAERLLRAVRPEDTVSRFAGDEFTVLLEDVGDPSVVVELTERMHAIFAEPIHTAARDVIIGASVGVAFANAQDTADVMVHAADSAMYDVKRARSPRDAVIV